jgi:hypothetical protein
MAPNKSSSNGGGSKAAAAADKKKGSAAAANDEWMKEATSTAAATKTTNDSSKNSSSSKASTSNTATQMELHDYVWVSAAVFVLYKVLATAYDIRLTSIKEYGPVIHEYDPYFNYRATEVSVVRN